MFVWHMWRKGETVLVKSHYAWCPLVAVVLITPSVAFTLLIKHYWNGDQSQKLCVYSAVSGLKAAYALSNNSFELHELPRD